MFDQSLKCLTKIYIFTKSSIFRQDLYFYEKFDFLGQNLYFYEKFDFLGQNLYFWQQQNSTIKNLKKLLKNTIIV